MNEIDFLKHEKISDRFHVVRESFGHGVVFNVYIIIGDNKVAIIDSSIGATGGLRRYIETHVTDKRPMACYMTHGHLDHFGGAILFDEVYLNHREYPKVPWNLNVPRRLSDLDVFADGNKEILDFCKEHYIHNENVSYRDVDDGDIIDLGGVRLEVIMLPGHSPGLLTYFNRADNYVIVGDSLMKTNAGYTRCDDMPKSLEYLNRFIAMMPGNVVMYNGHEVETCSIDLAHTFKTSMEDIIAGRTQNDLPSPAWFSYRLPEDSKMKRMVHYVGNVGMAYDANRYGCRPEGGRSCSREN
jgi:hydroxyacylglutathione hydrolase